MYRVVKDLTVKVNGMIKTFKVGSIVKLPFQSAQMFIQQGKIEPMFEPMGDLNERMCIMGENTEPGLMEPYVTDFGILVIPWNSDTKYHYWNGGQSPCDTLKELGRGDLVEKYKSFYSN